MTTDSPNVERHPKKGWVVYNGFLQWGKNREPADQLCEAAKRLGEDLTAMANCDIRCTMDRSGVSIDGDRPDYVIFWDKDIRLARSLEAAGIPVFNSSEAIEACDDKSLTGIILAQHGIRTPRTIIAPKTYASCGFCRKEFIHDAVERLGLPVVVKECRGSFGFQVHLFETVEEIQSFADRIGDTPFLLQEFIKSSSGRDIRINMVGEVAVASMFRHSANGDFRANVTNGGLMEYHQPNDSEVDIAIKCMRALGLDFAGIDILFGEDGPVVCEVNSNAHMKNILMCTGINVADHIIRYVVSVIDNE